MVLRISKSDKVAGISSLSDKTEDSGVVWKPYQTGKQQRVVFKNASKRSSGTLNLIYTDLCGSMPTCSVGGAKYFMFFIDDHSRYVGLWFLKTKNEAIFEFINWKSPTENQPNNRIKSIRSGRVGEFLSNEFAYTLNQSGIQHKTTMAYTPQKNGAAERMMRCEIWLCYGYYNKLEISYISIKSLLRLQIKTLISPLPLKIVTSYSIAEVTALALQMLSHY